MTALYIAIGVVAGLLLLIVMAFLFGRARIRIVCRDKLTVRASILGIRFTLYPDKKEKPEEKKSLKKCRNPHRALQRELARQEKAARKKLKALEKARKKKKKYLCRMIRRTADGVLYSSVVLRRKKLLLRKKSQLQKLQ